MLTRQYNLVYLMRILVSIILTMVVLTGCNAIDDSPVTQPGSGISDHPMSGINDAAPGAISWGTWQVSINPVDYNIEITPLRSTEFIANVTMFLQPPAGANDNLLFTNLGIDLDSDPGNALIELDVGLKHPFPGIDQYTGFDVRGIFLNDLSHSSEYDSSVQFGLSPQLVNPDGYTRWMNAVEFAPSGILGFTEGQLGSQGFMPTSTINPYKYFSDGLEPYQNVAEFFSIPENIITRGYFRAGSVNYRHYNLIFPATLITFQYSVIAAYDEPDVIPPTDIPADFPLSANCDEAFHIEITDNGSTAYYASDQDFGGDLHLNLEIFDWGVLTGGTINDEVTEITLESPTSGLITDPVTFIPGSLSPGSGTDISSVYQVDIPSVQPDSVDDQYILVTVGSMSKTNYDYGLGGVVPDAVLASYTIYLPTIYSQLQGESPTAVAEACDCLFIAPGGSITFDGTQSTSPNGAIVQWEWDFNGDGNFSDTYTGPPEHPTCTFDSPGTYNVNLKVTDEAAQTDTLAPAEQLEVQVGSWSPPVADSYITPTIGFIGFDGEFEASGSSGSIDLYEWDFEGDCIWDYEHQTIGDTTHAYSIADTFDAMLRVTGSGCDSVSTVVRMIEPAGLIQDGNFWDAQWGAWTHSHAGVPYATYIEEIIPHDTFRHIVHFHRSGTSDGGMSQAMQILNLDVTGYSELYLNMFLMIDQSSLYGDGWMGGEPDMVIRLVYDDGSGAPWEHAWYGWDGEFDGQWQWETSWLPGYVKHFEIEQVAEDTWHEEKTQDIMSISPPPIEIKYIQIASHGWGWDTYFQLPHFSEE